MYEDFINTVWELYNWTHPIHHMYTVKAVEIIIHYVAECILAQIRCLPNLTLPEYHILQVQGYFQQTVKHRSCSLHSTAALYMEELEREALKSLKGTAALV